MYERLGYQAIPRVAVTARPHYQNSDMPEYKHACMETVT